MHIRELAWRACRAAAVIVLALDVLGWSTDLVLVAGDPPLHWMLTEMRGGTAVLCVAMFARYQFVPWSRRAPIATAFPFALGLTGFAAFELAKMGGVEKPLFDFLMFAIVPTIVAPTSLGVRIAFVSGLVVVLCSAFFGLWRSTGRTRSPRRPRVSC